MPEESGIFTRLKDDDWVKHWYDKQDMEEKEKYRLDKYEEKYSPYQMGIGRKTEPTPESLAQEHWEYVKGLIDHIGTAIQESQMQTFEFLYKTAFIHGYKHGSEDK